MPPPPTTKPMSRPALPPTSSRPAAAKAPAKTFSIAAWSDSTEGQKVLLYGKSGIGKTTLAAMFPDAVFIGLDDGGRKIYNPKTAQPVNAILGVESFQDMRDAIQQSATLIPEGGTLVIDTITKLEQLVEPYLFATIKTDKGGTAANMESYGWGKGYRHLLDHMRFVLTDLDGLIRAGRNVVLLAQLSQARIANAEGSDYLEDGVKLYHSAQVSVRTEVGEWSDHVLRIGYSNLQVHKDNVQAKAGKVSGDSTRAVFSDGALHFMAKSRPVKGKRLPAIISFGAADDDSLIQMLFHGAIP
jgi:hypothetical protein